MHFSMILLFVGLGASTTQGRGKPGARTQASIISKDAGNRAVKTLRAEDIPRDSPPPPPPPSDPKWATKPGMDPYLQKMLFASRQRIDQIKRKKQAERVESEAKKAKSSPGEQKDSTSGSSPSRSSNPGTR